VCATSQATAARFGQSGAVSADEESIERERRQLRLMLDRLDRFRSGELSIGPVIKDLKALLNELQLANEDWRQEFIDAWSALEIPYAVAVDRLEPIPTIADATVAEGVDQMDNLARGQLEALSTYCRSRAWRSVLPAR
jgi:hypothetical protein